MSVVWLDGNEAPPPMTGTAGAGSLAAIVALATTFELVCMGVPVALVAGNTAVS